MRNLSKKAKTIIAGAAIAGLASTGVAYAYWTTTGAGSGAASTGTTLDFTIVGQGTTGLPLSPNGPTQTAVFKVHNPGSGSQYVTQVVVSIANADGSAWNSGTCTKDDFKVGGQNAGLSKTLAVGENLATGTDSTEQSVSIQMFDTGIPQNACKSITSVPLYYSVS